MTSALASLTATYTDSEGEEDPNENQNVGEASVASKSPADIDSNQPSPTTFPLPPSPTRIKVTTKVANLVSYLDDTVASDEGETEEVPHEVILMLDDKGADNDLKTDDDVSIPPEPAGHCSAELQDKISKLHEKMQTQQLDMNALIQKRKDFRNPSIYEKLIQFCDLNELGTNYPPSIYDPQKWNKESYYEELAKVQKQEMDKREKERKSKMVEVLSGTKKAEDDKKRKSKWDQPSAGSAAIPTTVKPAGVVQPSLTTSATGTKGTVISAFGSLPKKPRP